MILYNSNKQCYAQFIGIFKFNLTSLFPDLGRMLVIGGGLGGLSAAHYLLKSGLTDVKIIEASSAVGGWVRSMKDQRTGLVFEKGPRTIRVNTPAGLNTLGLIDELAIADKVRPILRSHPSAKNRLIYVNSKLWPLPTEFNSIFKKVPPFSKPLVFSLFRDLYTFRKTCIDDTVYSFVERRFGSEIADYLISSLICGICAGDAKEISVKFLMPGLFEGEQKHGSALKGMFYDMFEKKKKDTPLEGLAKRAIEEKWSVFGMDGGMAELPNAIRKSVLDRKAQIICGTPVTNISFKDGSAICKVGSDEIKTEHVFCSLPSLSVAPLLRNEHPKLAELLSKIPYVTVSVVNLAYKGKVMNHDAFGFLIPPSQGLPILGVIFDSCNFPQGDWTVLTVMLGGRWFDKYIGQKSESDIFKLVKEQIKTIMGIEVEPDSYSVSILKDCIPQYSVGHYENVENIFSYIKENKLPITLVGSSYRGVGVNDVIVSAKTGVEAVARQLGI